MGSARGQPPKPHLLATAPNRNCRLPLLILILILISTSVTRGARFTFLDNCSNRNLYHVKRGRKAVGVLEFGVFRRRTLWPSGMGFIFLWPSPEPSISWPYLACQAAGKPKRQLQAFYQALNISGITQPVSGRKIRRQLVVDESGGRVSSQRERQFARGMPPGLLHSANSGYFFVGRSFRP